MKCRIPQASDTGQPAKLPFSGETDGLKVETITGLAVVPEGADGTRDGRELPRTTGDATGEIKGGPADSINDGDCEMAVVGLSVASPTRLSGDLLGRTAGTRLATGDLSGCILSVGTKVGALISVGKDVGGVLGQGLPLGDKLGSGLVLRVADGT